MSTEESSSHEETERTPASNSARRPAVSQEPTDLSDSFSPVDELLDEIRAGHMIILTDDEKRENEGDLTVAAECVTPEIINFMARHGRGLICLALDGATCTRLNLHPQTGENTAAFGTAFTVSVDARDGITTGISAKDRSHTILTATQDDCSPTDLVRPGHIFPLRAVDGGVLVRAGQTEGSVDLARLAGLKPAAVICEIMNDDGSMARVPELTEFAKTHGLKMGSVPDVIRHRRKTERLVHHAVKLRFPTNHGRFDLHVFLSNHDERPHLALCMGGIGDTDDSGRIISQKDPVLLRVHSECLTGDVFGSCRCDCGQQLHKAMEMVAEVGRGVILYMRQEGRGIGIMKKLEAYALQEQGFDTVEANQMLGFGADMRDYGVGAQVLSSLGLKKLKLITNNPMKIVGLEGYGLEIVERVPIQIEAHEASRDYLKTKRDKLGHLLKGI